MSDETDIDNPSEQPSSGRRTYFKRISALLRASVLIRFLTIGALILVMQIPLAMVEGIVIERGHRHRAVQREIAEQWGHAQVLQGPILVVPFREKLVSQKKVFDNLGRWRMVDEATYRERTAIALPQSLDLDINLTTEKRRRGLFDVLVYGAAVGLKSSFRRPDIASLSKEEIEIDWDKAFIAIGLSDTHAIKSVSEPTWGSRARPLAPNTRITNLVKKGFHIPLDAWDENSESMPFALDFAVNGSRGFRFAPVGARTEVKMRSDWPHPSFQGTALPVAHDINDDGFQATWRIPSLARNFPQLWAYPAERHKLDQVMAGVDLAEPVFLYSKLTRAVKYGILYVALTFLTFLVFELTIRARLHLVQYGLIGLSLSLFYLTLLSLAEHIAFESAYFAAAGVIVALVTIYAWAALRRFLTAAIAGLALAALYGVLYTLLQMEDFALLAGTGVLLLVIAALMAVTRNLGRERSAEASGAVPEAA